MHRLHDMPFGPRLLDGGGVEFRLWAPGAAQVRLAWGPEPDVPSHEMHARPDGWHVLALPQARVGDAYRFVMPDGVRVPDPASRWNPDDVHGASRVVDPRAHDWRDDRWRGRPWHEAVVYELHVGTFTPRGTYRAARDRLPALALMGVTAIELMPLAEFPGRRGWGYDGVLPFAPHATYGSPDELKAFIEAAHALGLMVLVDVVYNHFGPEGNYLHAFCPQFFNPAHHTPWGAAINYDDARNGARTVRDFFIHNALYWVEEFHCDGLRMDAVHAIRDDSQPHVVREICEALRGGPGRERHVHVVLENDANQASLLARERNGSPRWASAQWNDDLHHAAHVIVTGEADGYYADYAQAPVADFARALAQGFVYQGQPSAFRQGEPRGEPSDGLPLSAFVSYLQTHDQVGNRAFGERIHALSDAVLLDAAHACVLLSPHVPMLFMGEEYAAATPFQYFCDFGAELAQAVSAGRREEFKRFAAFADESARALIPDPNDPQTYTASTLRWEERQQPPHAATLARMHALLALRQRELVPRFAAGAHGRGHGAEGGLLRVCWQLGDGAQLHLLANFGGGAASAQATPGRVLWSERVHAGAAGLALERGGVHLSLHEHAVG